MGLARDLVELEEAVRTDGLVDLFDPIDRSVLTDLPASSSMIERLRALGFRDPSRILRLCLQSLRVQHNELTKSSIQAELVATLPPGMPGIARTTDQVISEMLRPPVEEAIVVGYELTDRHALGLLKELDSTGVSLTVICDRARGAAQRLKEVGLNRSRIFQDRGGSAEAPYSSMHAKCLLVDGSDLLVTSANLTFHGLHGNIEIGVRMTGPPALEARQVFSHLVEAGIVEEVQ